MSRWDVLSICNIWNSETFTLFFLISSYNLLVLRLTLEIKFLSVIVMLTIDYSDST